MRECGIGGSFGSGPRSPISPQPSSHQPQPQSQQQKPLLTKKLSSQNLGTHQQQHVQQQHAQQLDHHQQQQQQHRQPVPLQGRFRSATAGRPTAAAADAVNPVRAALNRAFPASPRCGGSPAMAAARAARAFSNEDLASHGQWAAAAAPATPRPASEAQPLRSSDAGVSGAGGLLDVDEAPDPTTAAWPGRRSRRGASSSAGGSFSISASVAGRYYTS